MYLSTLYYLVHFRYLESLASHCLLLSSFLPLLCVRHLRAELLIASSLGFAFLATESLCGLALTDQQSDNALEDPGGLGFVRRHDIRNIHIVLF